MLREKLGLQVQYFRPDQTKILIYSIILGVPINIGVSDKFEIVDDF